MSVVSCPSDSESMQSMSDPEWTTYDLASEPESTINDPKKDIGNSQVQAANIASQCLEDIYNDEEIIEALDDHRNTYATEDDSLKGSQQSFGRFSSASSLSASLAEEEESSSDDDEEENNRESKRKRMMQRKETKNRKYHSQSSNSSLESFDFEDTNTSLNSNSYSHRMLSQSLNSFRNASSTSITKNIDSTYLQLSDTNSERSRHSLADLNDYLRRRLYYAIVGIILVAVLTAIVSVAVLATSNSDKNGNSSPSIASNSSQTIDSRPNGNSSPSTASNSSQTTDSRPLMDRFELRSVGEWDNPSQPIATVEQSADGVWGKVFFEFHEDFLQLPEEYSLNIELFGMMGIPKDAKCHEGSRIMGTTNFKLRTENEANFQLVLDEDLPQQDQYNTKYKSDSNEIEHENSYPSASNGKLAHAEFSIAQKDLQDSTTITEGNLIDFCIRISNALTIDGATMPIDRLDTRFIIQQIFVGSLGNNENSKVTIFIANEDESYQHNQSSNHNPQNNHGTNHKHINDNHNYINDTHNNTGNDTEHDLGNDTANDADNDANNNSENDNSAPTPFPTLQWRRPTVPSPVPLLEEVIYQKIDTILEPSWSPTDSLSPTTTAVPTMAPATSAPTRTFAPTKTPTTSAPTGSFAPTAMPTTSEPSRSFAPTFAPTTSEPTRSFAPTFAPTTSEPSRSFAPTFAPTTSEPTRSFAPTSAPTTSEPTSSFAPTSAPTTSAPTKSLAPTNRPTTTFDPTEIPMEI